MKVASLVWPPDDHHLERAFVQQAVRCRRQQPHSNGTRGRAHLVSPRRKHTASVASNPVPWAEDAVAARTHRRADGAPAGLASSTPQRRRAGAGVRSRPSSPAFPPFADAVSSYQNDGAERARPAQASSSLCGPSRPRKRAHKDRGPTATTRLPHNNPQQPSRDPVKMAAKWPRPSPLITSASRTSLSFAVVRRPFPCRVSASRALCLLEAVFAVVCFSVFVVVGFPSRLLALLYHLRLQLVANPRLRLMAVTRAATGEVLAKFLRATSFAVVGASPAPEKVCNRPCAP